MATFEELVAAAQGYWPLQETSGTVAVDSTGNGHDGTLNNLDFASNSQQGPTPWLPKSLHSSAGSTARYVEVPSHADLSGGGNWSVGGWFKGDSSHTIRTISKGDDGGGNKDFDCFWHPSYGCRIGMQKDGVSTYVGAGISSHPGGGANVWIHCISTYNSTTGVITVYVNGVNIHTTTNVAASAATTATLRMFNADWVSGGITGNLAGIGVWNTDMPVQDVRALYDGPVKLYQELVDEAEGYWSFQETSGNANDSSGGGRTGYLENLSFSEDSVTGPNAWLPKALATDGTPGQRVTVNGSEDLTGARDFTVGAWINFTALQSCIHFSKAKNGSNKDFLLYYSAVDAIRFAGTAASTLLCEYVNPPSGWGYASASYEHATTTSKLYYNGELVDVDTTGASNSTDASIVFFQQEYAANGAVSNGAIAGAGIWGRVFSDAEHQIMKEGPIVLYDDLVAEAVGYWPLQEAAGTVASDTSGNGRDGTLNGMEFSANKVAGPTFWLPSALRTGISGSNNVSIPDHEDFRGGGDFTIAGWVDGSDSSTENVYLLSKATSVTEKDWSLAVWGSNHNDVPNTAGFLTEVGGVDYREAVTRPLGWFFLSASYNNTTGLLRIYINGTLALEDVSAGHSGSSTTPLKMFDIGYNNYDNAGSLAGVGFWKRSLEAGEHRAMFEGPGVPSNVNQSGKGIRLPYLAATKVAYNALRSIFARELP